ncbi:MAG TPA: hypothetical protein DCL61_24115 [Cyanobacteria bacterium UBA12227]|nr:hypothetical protein [Cyanobacteria bacterium UBA12227]HAX88590.1 hypothetical protein [Cyanobacteria bacterium UBA11370]HBY76625.1 hypothetical protein [Cyanobacteria bacterium UBA11148]
MLLEDYFNFLAPDDIRLKGTRIGIETILFDHIFRAKTPEEIVKTYPSLTLEQVYATILYYLHNQPAVEAYMTDWLEWGDKMRAEQQSNPRPIVERLRKLKAQKLAKSTDNAQVSY